MNDQQQSRADALTDEFVKRAFYAADCRTWYEMYPSAAMDVAREILAASPVEQRAAALTEAQRKALETAVNVLNINWEHETANELWEAFTAPVSQPAAAPIDTPTDREFALSAAICVHPKGVYGDEGGSMCCPITHTRDASFAPSPADERDKG
ncbi:hypothetical protein UA21_01729 [Burkholderia multivorans]|nr:hypothetical protein UA21_01729 [Burkholderia multivorans]